MPQSLQMQPGPFGSGTLVTNKYSTGNAPDHHVAVGQCCFIMDNNDVTAG
jgi:hypothetical protein